MVSPGFWLVIRLLQKIEDSAGVIRRDRDISEAIADLHTRWLTKLGEIVIL